MNEKMRAEFEVWLVGFRNNGDLESIVAARSTDSDGATTYRFDDDDATMGITAMWLGWQASRAALEVELPFKFGNGMMRADQVIAAIEAAGARVKP